MKKHMRIGFLSLLILLLSAPMQLRADDMKDSKNFWMNTHSNYLEFTVLVTDLRLNNTYAKDGYIRAYTSSNRSGTPINLLRVYTKDMGNDASPFWEVFARNMIRGSKAFMQNTLPMGGDASPDGSLSLEEQTFNVNKGSGADDTFVIIDYYYSPELAGKTLYFFYEYEHNDSGWKVMSLGSAQCSEMVDCSKFNTTDYSLQRKDIGTIQLNLPAMPNDIDQKLQDVRKHIGHYDVTFYYNLFDGTTKTQTESFDCQLAAASTANITIPIDVRNFKSVDATIESRDALEADGGQCFWDERQKWELRDLFPYVPQPNNLHVDYLQFDNKVDLTWSSYSAIDGSNYIQSTYPYVFRIETDQYGTPKSGQKWSRRDKLSVINDTQGTSYSDQHVAADGKYYKYLILNVPKDWENKSGLTGNELQNPSDETIQSLGHIESDVVSAAAHVSIFNLQQDVTVKDKVRLTWEYSRVPVSGSSSTVNFEMWRCLTGTSNWEAYATNIKGDANPKAGYTVSFTDSDLPNNTVSYDYKVVLKLNGGQDVFESDVITAGLLTGTTVTELTATKGVHDDVVRLAWKASQVGTGNSTFELSRRYAGSNDDFLTINLVSGSSDSYTFEDKTVQPGRYYEYRVKAFAGEKVNADDNNYQNMLTDVGFCQARGVISGRVTFGQGDASVEDVRLTLRCTDEGSENQVTGYSQRIDDLSTGITWKADSAEMAKVFGNDKNYTMQLFVRPDDNLAEGSVIGEIPGVGRLLLGSRQGDNYKFLIETTSEATKSDNLFSQYWDIQLVFEDDTAKDNKEPSYYNEELGAWMYNSYEGYIAKCDSLAQNGYSRITAGWYQTTPRYFWFAAYGKAIPLSEQIHLTNYSWRGQIFDTELTLPVNVYSLISFEKSNNTYTVAVNDQSKTISESASSSKEHSLLSGETNLLSSDFYFYGSNCLYKVGGLKNELLLQHSGRDWFPNMATGVSSTFAFPRSFSVGGGEAIDTDEAFHGNITEVRVWNHALTDKEKEQNNDRMLSGRETGLQLYWPMDEGIDRLVFDASYANDLPNGRHAVVGANVSVSRIIPNDNQLSRYALTNNKGEYTLRGIPFIGSGSTYTITPTKSIHVFSPTSRNGFISSSSLTLNSYNFTDESSFTVRGKVTYLNTNIPVDSVNFKIDGALASTKSGAITTDSKGEYVLSVPIGSHLIEAYRDRHLLSTFPADGTTYEFLKPEVVNFTDSTLVNVTGRINGGFSDKDAPLGFRKSVNRLGKAVVKLSLGREAMSSFNYVVDSHGDGKFGTTPLPVSSATANINSHTIRAGGTQDETHYIYITTDSLTGEFSAMLPPLKYKVESIHFVGGKDYDEEPIFKQNLPTIDATNVKVTNMSKDSLKTEAGNVEYYDYTVKFMRQLRVEPTIEVAQDDMEHGGFGAKIVDVALENGKTVTVPVMEEDENGPTYFYGHPLFVQRNEYPFHIDVSEQYQNLDSKETYKEIPEDAVVSIMNSASLSTLVYGKEIIVDGKKMTPGKLYEVQNVQVKPDEKGRVRYNWGAGWPNLSDGYLRNISIGVNVGGRTTMWKAPNSQTDALDVVVLGGIPTGTNFITQAPSHVDMVIRRPPGNTASATLVNDTIHNYYHLESSYSGSGAGGGAFVNIPPTMTVLAGFGILTGTSFRPYGEETLKESSYNENDEKSDSTYTYTLSTTIKTPSGGTYTQNNGDTYIGRGTNILFGKGRSVGLFQQPNGTYKLESKESICFSSQFTTSFAYSQQYIEDVQIPNWKKKIQSLLTEVEGDLTDDKVCPIVPGKIMYYTNLKKDDPRRGTRNIDDCWTEAEYNAAHGYPSYRMVGEIPEIQTDSSDPIKVYDSIQWCNNEILNWQERIKDNEREKLEVFALDSCFIDNYSIAFGTSVSQTTKNSELLNSHTDTDKNSYTVNLELHLMGFLWNNSGGYGILTYNNKWGNTETTTKSDTKGQQFSWTISDSEPTTALSVNVYKSNRGWGPIFRTMGGQTSNPYEGATYTKYHEPGTELDKATMRVENPQLSVEGANTVSNVPTGGQAQFTLVLKNANEVNTNATYMLDVLENSNPDGAILTIDGAVLSKGGGGRKIKMKSGEEIKKILFVQQGNRDVVNYRDIGLILRSEKDTTTISDPVYLNVQFVPSSAHVEMYVDRTVLNKTDYELNKGFLATITNLDRQDNGLVGVRLQYRRKGISSWTLAKEWKAKPAAGETAIPEGKSFTWPILMDDDGIYELRAQTFGTYGPEDVTYETDIIEVTQDLDGPKLLGSPYPETGYLAYLTKDDMHIRFNEDINSNAISKSDNFRIEGNLNNAVVDSKVPDVAVQLNGTEYSTQATFDLGVENIAIEGWFYRQGDGRIFAIGTEKNMLAAQTHDDGKLVMRVGPRDNLIETGLRLPANKWNYIAISYEYAPNNDGKAKIKALYTNYDVEIPYMSEEISVDALSGNGKLRIGGESMVGMIHDLAIWNNKTNVYALYNNKNELKASYTPGLIAHWPMNEGHGTTLVDRQRSRNIVMPTESWYINNNNLAAQLSADDQVAIDISRFAPRHTDSYALEMWFRSANENKNATLMQVDNRIKIGFTNGAMTFTTYEDPGYEEVNSKVKETFVLTGTDYNDSQWHHLALNVRRGTGAIAYIDGQSVKTLPETSIPAISGNKLYIGGNFEGDIDEVRIWNAALTGNLIEERRYARLDSTYAGLIGYFPMESISRESDGNIVATFSLENFGNNSMHYNLALVDPVHLKKANNSPALLPGSHTHRFADSDFEISVSDREIYINFNDDMLARMDGNEFTVTVSNVKDLHNNSSEPIVWRFVSDFSIWDWISDDTKITKDSQETVNVALQIYKLSGGKEDFEILNLPTWITTEKTIGSSSENFVSLTFKLLPSAPIGTHTVEIYVSDRLGIKRSTTLVVEVTGDDPKWSVNPDLYESNMIVIGQLYVGDKICEYEKSYIAAFDELGECRGIGHPEYVSTRDAYYLTMNIYGAASTEISTGQRRLTFKMYNASTGVICPLVQINMPDGYLTDSLTYSAEALYGSYDRPLIFIARNGIEQLARLARGWNWVSLYVNPPSNSISNVMPKGASNVNNIMYVKSQTAISTTKNGAFVGEVTNMYPGEMYKIQTRRDMNFNIIGTPIDVTTTSQTIHHGYNWIGTLSSEVMSPDVAFADLNPEKNDMVKNRSGFTMYRGDGVWEGVLKSIIPGEGYIYYSVAEGNKTFHYPKLGTQTSYTPRHASPAYAPAQHYSPVDPYNFPDNMNVIAVVVQDGQLLNDVEIGAFVNGECRGAIRANEGSDYYFLTVMGSSADDQNRTVELRVFANGEEYVVDQSHTFINDLILGNLDEPYVLDLDEASGIKGIFTGEGLDDDGWYTLQGFKLPRKPRLRGVYIHNGTKVVIE